MLLKIAQNRKYLLTIFICIALLFENISLQSSQSATITTETPTGSIVYPQLNGIINFKMSSLAIQIQTDMGTFGNTKQFSLWGWYRPKNYFTFKSPSNIITLQNVQNYSGSDLEIGPFPNPNYPTCKFTLEQIKENPSLKLNQDVIDNPNCNPMEIMNASQIESNSRNFSITNDEIFFLNYNLTHNDPKEVSNNKYQLEFYLKDREYGAVNTNPGQKGSMKKYLIKDLPFVQNLWTFWGVAANYETGEVVLFMKVFGPNGYERLVNEKINYPEFNLNEGALLLIAATNMNQYFQSLAGYIGEVAYIQMSSYFLKDMNRLWLAEMLVEDTTYDGINSEILFDSYKKSNELKSYGYKGGSIQLNGNYEPVFLSDESTTGVNFKSKSSFKYADFPYRSSPFVSSHPFLLDFQYKEGLPDEFVIMEKGTLGQSGYLAIKLVKDKLSSNPNRKLKIEARSSNKDFVWESEPIFQENTQYNLMTGIVVTQNRTAHAVMKLNDTLIVSDGVTEFENYDFSYKNVVGVNNPSNYDGDITMNRVSILDNFSGSLLQNLELSNRKIENLAGDCKMRTDFFHGSFGCLKCKEGVNIIETRSCAKFCPIGKRNNGSGICVKCQFEDCRDIPKLTWTVEKTSNSTYRLTPNRAIQPANFDITKLIDLKVGNLKQSDYTYTLKQGNNNEYVDVDFDFKKSIFDQKVDIKVTPNSKETLFDGQGNLLTGSNFDFKVDNVCKLSEKTKDFINGLALFIVIFTLIGMVLALIILCACTKKLKGEHVDERIEGPKDSLINAIWKFLLHNWMKLQMVAFLLLINTSFPCCMKLFFESLYKYAVSWAHGMGSVWDSTQQNNINYQNGINESSVPDHLFREGIKSFLLHNMGVVFIFHLVVMMIYLVFKIADIIRGSTEDIFYKIFIMVQYNLLILGYLLFHMMAFVFSFLNFAFPNFSTPYFVISFLISILYILGKNFFI